MTEENPSLTLSERTNLYRASALVSDTHFLAEIKRDILNEITANVKEQDFEKVRELTTDLQQTDVNLAHLIQSVVTEAEGAIIFKKAAEYFKRGRFEETISLIDSVIETGDVSTTIRSLALLLRGTSYLLQSEHESSLRHHARLIELPDAPREMVAEALLGRGLIYSIQQNYKAAIQEYTRLIELPDTPVEWLARALLGRGRSHSSVENHQAAIKDCTQLINLPDVSVKLSASALWTRGRSHSSLGDIKAAIQEYTRLIELPDAPIELVTSALLARASTYSLQKDYDSGIQDCERLIELHDIPGESAPEAQLLLGWLYWVRDDYQSSYDSLSTLLITDGIQPPTRTLALFLITLPLVALSEPNNVLGALEKAFTEGAPEVDAYGGDTANLVAMVIRAGPLQWDAYVPALIDLYGKYTMLDRLGQGLTQSIWELDTRDYAPTLMTQWVEIWEKHGREKSSLEIPLQALSAAVSSIIAGNDRPLFELPLEIRNLVRPLLNNKLGPAPDLV